MYLLGFEIQIFGISYGCFFALHLKSIMVSFRVPNLHDFNQKIRKSHPKCLNLFDFFLHTDI